MEEISRYHEKVKSEKRKVKNIESANTVSSKIPRFQDSNTPLFGITGCMVRKTGLAKRYLQELSVIPTKEESARKEADPSYRQDDKKSEYKRKQAMKISLLESSESIANYDDELFLRSPLIDFTFRIEEVAFVTKILSLISHEEI